MKAVIVDRFGGPEVLRLVTLPDPVPGEGQVRVAVHAAGTNPVDAANRADGRWAGLTAPCVLGYEIAGVVDAVGPGVSGLSVGRRVMAMTRFRDGAGGYAELAVVEAREVSPIGSATSFVEAAATPVAGGTAHDVLGRLRPVPGAVLLVLGASGGVGTFLLQLAATAGLKTVAVGRAATHDRMRELGATWCVDYTTESVAERASELVGGPVDAIADLVGGEFLATTVPALRNGGAIASIETPVLDLDPLLDANITFHGVLLRNDGDRTRQLAGLLEAGTLRSVITSVLPLGKAAEAHRMLEGRHSGGKIVLSVAT